jgi:hypothetical protein
VSVPVTPRMDWMAATTSLTGCPRSSARAVTMTSYGPVTSGRQPGPQAGPVEGSLLHAAPGPQAVRTVRADQRPEQRRQLPLVVLHAHLGVDPGPRVARHNRSPVPRRDPGRHRAVPNGIGRAERELVQVALRYPLDASHHRGVGVQQVWIHHEVADDRVPGQRRDPTVGHRRPAGIRALRGVNQHVGDAEPLQHVVAVHGEVAPQGGHLHAGQPHHAERLVAPQPAVLRGRLHGVLPHGPRPQDRYPDRWTDRVGQQGVGMLERVERRLQAVPSHCSHVLHQTPALVVGDRVQADGLQAQVVQASDPCRPGREVQHGDEGCPRPHPAQLVLGRSKDDDHVLAERGGAVDHPEPRTPLGVVEVRVAHPGPQARFHVHRRPHVRQQVDQPRDEVPALARLLSDAREAESQRACAARHLDSSARAAARSKYPPSVASHSAMGLSIRRPSTGSTWALYTCMHARGSTPGHA